MLCSTERKAVYANDAVRQDFKSNYCWKTLFPNVVCMEVLLLLIRKLCKQLDQKLVE